MPFLKRNRSLFSESDKSVTDSLYQTTRLASFHATPFCEAEAPDAHLAALRQGVYNFVL